MRLPFATLIPLLHLLIQVFFDTPNSSDSRFRILRILMGKLIVNNNISGILIANHRLALCRFSDLLKGFNTEETSEERTPWKSE